MISTYRMLAWFFLVMGCVFFLGLCKGIMFANLGLSASSWMGCGGSLMLWLDSCERLSEALDALREV